MQKNKYFFSCKIKKLLKKTAVFFIMLFYINSSSACSGKFVNPITDICWSCLFPIYIGMFSSGPLKNQDTKNPKGPICICPKPGVPFPMPGIPIGFWEPARLIDIVREPFCLVSLGGIKMGSSYTTYGTHGASGNRKYNNEKSFYHVHWYRYPLLMLLEILKDFVCLELGFNKEFDLLYLTEFDPMWADDGMNFILNPEAALFGNPIAELACSADCVKASASTAFDSLFWCAGCLGGIYPFTGTVEAHAGGVNSSLLIAAKFIAKLHRQLLLPGTSGPKAKCSNYVCPFIKKSQYRLQMVYPRPATKKLLGCHPLGRTSVLLESGREYPMKGEDFAYLIWRKKNCCAL